MPELPEVAVVAQGLDRLIVGQTIRQFRVLSASSWQIDDVSAREFLVAAARLLTCGGGAKL